MAILKGLQIWRLCVVGLLLVFDTTSSFQGSKRYPPTTQKSHSESTSNMATLSSSNHETASLFPEDILHHDHYNGITIHLDNCSEQEKSLLDPSTFQSMLEKALSEWKAASKKGIWIHCPVENAELVPIATRLGFDFHMVHQKKILVLSQWLPEKTPNKLPLPPSHQVGVGCVVFCPWDPSLMLVVQEKTGPAAAWNLWKMPTGLSDPGEDVHLAAERELMEETGLKASFEGIIIMRQAHSSRSGTRSSSDLFFVCQMKLQLPEGFDPQVDKVEDLFKACPDEIAAIEWMSVEDYCNQERWQTSPVYLELNRAVLQASKSPNDAFLIEHQTLPLGFGIDTTNSIYYRRSHL